MENGVLLKQLHWIFSLKAKTSKKEAMHTFGRYFTISAALELKLNDTRVRTGFLL